MDNSILVVDDQIENIRKSRKLIEYENSLKLPPHLVKKMEKTAKVSKKQSNKKVQPVAAADNVTNTNQRLIGAAPDATGKQLVKPISSNSNNNNNVKSVGLREPEYHPQWKLMRVMSGHLGWVRCIAVDKDNQWFATGSADRTIKIWDLASGTLKLTLTGHSLAVRDLAISERSPYLFSVGEDKTVKLWDLEHNRVMRDYHGHKGGVYTVACHPTQDLVITAGRDCVAKIWDIRTRTAIHTLTGHRDAISVVKCQNVEPQIITASFDKTVRLWDIVAGKTLTTLTHHNKGVRALSIHPEEYTFASASTGSIKQWKCPTGQLLQNFEKGQDTIINTLSTNSDGVTFAGGNDGSMGFYDWKTGTRFQLRETMALPGSLDSEKGILASSFDQTGSRLITCEADKSVKVWREGES